MDFKGALNAGLLAAKKARSNREEIIGIISELNGTIREFSQGKVSLEITNESKLVGNHNVLTAMASAFGNGSAYKDYQALSFVRKSGGSSRKKIIAEWHLDDSDGYPCVISYNKQDVRCTTKDTLMKALNDLIADAQTGEALLELIESEDTI